MRWSHVGLNCADQVRTEEFYTRWFGFRRARAVPIDNGEIVFLRRDDAYLELFPVGGRTGAARGDGPPEPGTIRHLAFQTDDVGAFLRTMGDAAEVTLGPLGFDEAIEGWRTVWIRDPDGVVVEVSQGYRDQEREGHDHV
ncbi:hypothetical protein GCM10010156_59630 [Planobispora rosea]|uniref:VOC domain-containing protein n=1 Tax=Planobispora rosea TaxID=35762 RepID=A0A8J3S711_PLARO|nr:VOC family protein [Planobispora rosea]GGS93437.1 hypothetical protein GCM10010156_59630 [Planobispora rosea]GIH87265.1 hypothetical protein Pro02_56730 [Planobispora rosea]